MYYLPQVCSKKENRTAKSFFKTRKKGISQRVVENKDSLLPTSVTYSSEFLSSEAKLATMSEIGEFSDDNVSDDGMMFRNGERQGISASDIRAWVADADGNYHEFKPTEAAPKTDVKAEQNEAPAVAREGQDKERHGEEYIVSSAERTEMENRIMDWLSEENLKRAAGKTREEIIEEFGNDLAPIAFIPAEHLSLLGDNIKDPRIYCGKGYFIDHALRNHGGQGAQVNIDDIDVSKYLNIQYVLDNPDHIKETFTDGKRTVVFIKKIGRYFCRTDAIGRERQDSFA